MKFFSFFVFIFILLFSLVPKASAEWIEITKFSPEKICFSDEMNGMAFDSFLKAWITNDGGITWKSISMPAYPDTFKCISSCNIISNEKCYIGFKSNDFDYYPVKIYITSDYGNTWNDILLPEFTINTYKASPSFKDNGDLYIIAEETKYNSFLAVSENAGVTWTWTNLPKTTSFVHICNQNLRYAYSDLYKEINKTSDNGLTWNKVNIDSVLTEPVIYSKDIIWCFGGNKLLYTNNGGQTWKEKTINRLGNPVLKDVLTQKFAKCFPLDETRALAVTWDFRDVHLYLVDMANDKHYALQKWPYIEINSYYDDDFFYRMPAVLVGNRFYIVYHSNMLILTDVQQAIKEAVLVEEEKPIPFTLNPAYPNPFNPTTTISFSIPETSNVKLTIYNITGQKVCTLVDKTLTYGNHSVVWDANGMSSGVYFYTLECMGKKLSGKMTLMK